MKHISSLLMAAQFLFLAIALFWSIGIVTYCTSEDPYKEHIWLPSDKNEEERKEMTKKEKEQKENEEKGIKLQLTILFTLSFLFSIYAFCMSCSAVAFGERRLSDEIKMWYRKTKGSHQINTLYGIPPLMLAEDILVLLVFIIAVVVCGIANMQQKCCDCSQAEGNCKECKCCKEKECCRCCKKCRSSTDPTQSSTDPTQSSTDPTQSSTDPQKGSTDPTQSSTDPQKGSTDPTQSSTDPTKGSMDPKGSAGPVEGSTDSSKCKNCIDFLPCSCCCCCKKLCPCQIRRNAWWRLCAYSVIFPIMNIAVHANHILIGFIHNQQHALSVALFYVAVLITNVHVLRVVLTLLRSRHERCESSEGDENRKKSNVKKRLKIQSLQLYPTKGLLVKRRVSLKLILVPVTLHL